ncbi:hypothetical protein IJH72_01150 [Candidatus Saccharibacteria bacterium]|nr:hypothetical protein [Candidatus Saccharibacteria bacterium]MBR0372536.1 hypothetical protein [Candidatus Saccharibacteria bacterium]MBR3253468.1 hypothetical protein [Candidatus Saccharibacteria bacterium]
MPRCLWCRNIIPEGATKCPSCGAANQEYLIQDEDTPHSIAELQKWYEKHHLPPKEITRFFIGEDYSSPRAYGIYQLKSGDFVVYKNKDNGERAIRYSGPDETIAVREIFAKLKETILRQKENLLKRQNSRRVTVNHLPTRDRQAHRPTAQETEPEDDRDTIPENLILIDAFREKTRSPKKWLKSLWEKTDWQKISPKIGKIVNVAVIAIMAVVLLLYIGIEIKEINDIPKVDYYYLENEELYYNYGKTSNEEYEWWKYNDDIDDWEPYFYTARKYYPSPLSESSERSKTLPFKGHEQYTYEKYNIKASHGYLDVHHVKPSQNYYYLHGNTYFFFDCRDNHRTTDSTGWYIYNSSNEQWEFYAQYNDKNSIEDSLWYEPDIYSVPSNQKDDSIPDFENSSYYQEYYMSNDSKNDQHNNTIWYYNNNNWSDSDSNSGNSSNDNYWSNYANPNDSGSSSWSSGDNSYDWNNDSSSWDSYDSYDWSSDWSSSSDYDWSSDYSSWDSSSSYDWSSSW